jgi:hypothetical protein
MNPLSISEDALKRFRDAATRFARDASPRASRLLAVKGDIAALRKKGASFRTIGQLLTQNGIAASDTSVIALPATRTRRETDSQRQTQIQCCPQTCARCQRGHSSPRRVITRENLRLHLVARQTVGNGTSHFSNGKVDEQLKIRQYFRPSSLTFKL